MEQNKNIPVLNNCNIILFSMIIREAKKEYMCLIYTYSAVPIM